MVCTSVTFSSNGLPYSAVCGGVVGYQHGQTNGFHVNTRSGPLAIDGYYANGVTLTHCQDGAREHIWTFVSALEEHAPNLLYIHVPVTLMLVLTL